MIMCKIAKKTHTDICPFSALVTWCKKFARSVSYFLT